jgi:hypothetical protein
VSRHTTSRLGTPPGLSGLGCPTKSYQITRTIGARVSYKKLSDTPTIGAWVSYKKLSDNQDYQGSGVLQKVIRYPGLSGLGCHIIGYQITRTIGARVSYNRLSDNPDYQGLGFL